MYLIQPQGLVHVPNQNHYGGMYSYVSRHIIVQMENIYNVLAVGISLVHGKETRIDNVI